MKKLLLTLSLIVSVLALSAQSYQVTEKETGNIVENGVTYYVFGDGEASWGELNIEFNVTTFEHVRLIGEKVENNVVDGTLNYFCWGQCLSPLVYVSDPYDMPADSTDVFSMHYMYQNQIEDVLGMEQSMTYYLYEANNPDDKFTINVVFKYSLNEVENVNDVVEFSNAYPVPACDVVNFDYNFSNSVNAEIAIYNMMGQEVMRNDINGMSGKASINVSDLADGVYFYSLIVNGVVEKSNKLIIRR